MDRATADFILNALTMYAGPAITAAFVVAWRLRNINKVMEKISAEVLANTASRLEQDQESKFESLERRLESATRERDSLQQQVRTLIMIINEIKERHAAEKAEFEREIAELNARIDLLNAERESLLKLLGRSDDDKKEAGPESKGELPTV